MSRECLCVCVLRLLHACVFRLRGLKRGRETQPQVRLHEKRQAKTVELDSFVGTDVLTLVLILYIWP
jgi:hypothetical protein